MSYLKFNADHLFTGTEMLDNDSVLIADEQGVVEDIITKKEAGDDIQIFKGIISPGFINCHCHLELSHMKGMIPEKIGLIDFLITVVQQRNSPKEKILEAIMIAEEDLHRSGTAAVGDICNTTDSIEVKQKSELHYYTFIEVIGFSESTAEERFVFSKNIYDKFNQPPAASAQTSNYPHIPADKPQASLVPHAPYSVSNKMFQLINNASIDKTIAIHNQECKAEEELFTLASGDFYRLYKTIGLDSSSFKYSGKSSLQTFLPMLNKAKNIILVHNTFSTEKDILYGLQLAAQSAQQLFWCLCINANLYIEDAVPPVDMLLRNNCSIVLGTDSLASNRSLNLLEEIKTIQKKFPKISTEQLLRWATLNGAEALQLNNMLGSFEKGKQPGIILIDSIADKKISSVSTARRLI